MWFYTIGSFPAHVGPVIYLQLKINNPILESAKPVIHKNTIWWINSKMSQNFHIEFWIGLPLSWKHNKLSLTMWSLQDKQKLKFISQTYHSQVKQSDQQENDRTITTQQMKKSLSPCMDFHVWMCFINASWALGLLAC